MKNIAYFTLFAFLFLSCDTAVKKEINIASDPAVIGTWNLDNGETTDVLAGDTKNEQIWLDYIKAHNEKNLDIIASMNAEDWEGYLFDGTVAKGNKNHIEFLKGWFEASSPKWKTRWMIANAGVDENGEMTQWLTTGDDMKEIDAEGNETLLHLVHDIQIVEGKIKKIYVYSRAPETVKE
mgnify:FL=1|tara:strand:+ start:220 stop:759 length:540 start_codon:yes stop_codon:yes gene_type:complete